eukprot:480203-Pleurochrysis_carterae.AAC.1
MHAVRETWEVVVHSLARVDVHCLVGQSSTASLPLRSEGRQSRGLVQCFSSSPAEMSLNPDAPFALAAGAVTQLTLTLRPRAAGRFQHVVHAVDLASRTLVSSWLVCAVSRVPAITKSFSLTVPTRLGANRKVALSNPYTYDATFLLDTDSPHLLGFKQKELAVPAGDTRYIGLKFSPAPSPLAKSHKLLVFVNNDDDKNEECMEITVVYSDVAPAGGR